MSGTIIKEIQDEQDILNIIALGRVMFDENNTTVPFDPGMGMRKGLAVLNGTISRDQLTAWVGYKNDVPVGFLIAQMCYYFFNENALAQQEVLYVLPEHRGSWVGPRLIKAYEKWAWKNGALQIFVGAAMNNVDVSDRTGRLFARLGYERVGSYYKKELGDVAGMDDQRHQAA